MRKASSYGRKHRLPQHFCRRNFNGGNVPDLQNEFSQDRGGKLQIANHVSGVPCHYTPGRCQLPAMRQAPAQALNTIHLSAKSGYTIAKKTTGRNMSTTASGNPENTMPESKTRGEKKSASAAPTNKYAIAQLAKKKQRRKAHRLTIKRSNTNG
jgi:hypothetical protein